MQKAYCVIHLIEIYSVDSFIHLWNNESECFIRLLLEKGSYSNEDSDGNENVIKATALLDKKTNLHVHHTFLSNSLPSLHDYDVKMPYFTFSGGRKQATTNFLCFSKLKYGPQETNSGTFAHIWHFQQFGINAKNFEKTRIYFNSDVFAAVAVVHAKGGVTRHDSQRRFLA